MRKHTSIRISAAALLALAVTAGMSTLVVAQDKDQDRDRVQLRDQDRIYGSELMTQQERNEHRNQLRAMKTAQEREAYQLEHHKRMQERAREKGVKLSDEPLRKPGVGGVGGAGGGAGGKGK